MASCALEGKVSSAVAETGGSARRDGKELAPFYGLAVVCGRASCHHLGQLWPPTQRVQTLPKAKQLCCRPIAASTKSSSQFS